MPLNDTYSFLTIGIIAALAIIFCAVMTLLPSVLRRILVYVQHACMSFVRLALRFKRLQQLTSCEQRMCPDGHTRVYEKRINQAEGDCSIVYMYMQMI